MTGILLSDSTSIHSTHHRSACENRPSPHSDYHPHSSHSCLRQPPLSSFSILSTNPSTTPPTHLSPSLSTFREMPDRPTLPGIANLLALAGQHRSALLPSPPLPYPHRTRSSQLSDPVAHALPPFVDLPSFQKNPSVLNYPASPTSRDPPLHPRPQGHRRRRSSSTTVVNVGVEKRASTSTIPNRTHSHPLHHILSSNCCPPSLTSSNIHDQDAAHVRRRSNASASSSSSISGSTSLSSDFGTSLNITPQAQVCFNRGTHAASSSASVNSILSSHQDRTPPQYLPTERPWSNEAGGEVNQSWNSTSSTLEDQRSYACNPRWDPKESSSHHQNTNQGRTCNQSLESRSQMSVSPVIIPSPRLSGITLGNTVPCPQSHRYQCLELGCGKTFSRPSSLKIHSYSHTGQKPFKCMRCDRAFSVQSNLKRHQKVHEKRSIAVYSRGISGNGSATSPIVYESGSAPLLEEHSGEEDGAHDHMEE